MSKSIPIELLTHKAESATTLCDLMKVGPIPDGSFRYFTSHDVNLPYDDGDGAQTYIARTGLQMSAMVSTADLGVDNAEAESLYPVATYDIEGFTQTQIDSGVLDKTPFVVYRVNWKDLTTGRHEIMGGGTIGEQRTKFGQLTILELRSLSQQLKQTIGQLDSINCRARFGSQRQQNSNGDAIVERFPCEYDLDLEWVAGTVQAVGTDGDREFTDSGLTQDEDWFSPGVVRWTVGNNVGQETEVANFALGGDVELQFPTVNPILLGDEFEIRRECTKRKDGHNSCQTFFGSNWVLHFRGEPHIPIGDTGKLNSPGAAIA